MSKAKKVIKVEPVKYIVVWTSTERDYFMSMFNGPAIEYFTDIKQVMKFIKNNNQASYRVFEIAEELKMRTRVELDL